MLTYIRLATLRMCIRRDSQRQLHIHFLRSPARICESDDGKVSGMDVEVNKLHSSEDGTQQRAVGLGEYKSIPTQLVLESIGYMSHPLDGAPFDSSRGIIPNRCEDLWKHLLGSATTPDA